MASIRRIAAVLDFLNAMAYNTTGIFASAGYLRQSRCVGRSLLVCKDQTQDGEQGLTSYRLAAKTIDQRPNCFPLALFSASGKQTTGIPLARLRRPYGWTTPRFNVCAPIYSAAYRSSGVCDIN